MIQSGIYKFTSISQVCLGKVFMSKGFQWRFITNDIDYKINIDPCPKKRVENNIRTSSTV